MTIAVSEPEPHELVFVGEFHTIARLTDKGWRLSVDYETGAASEEDYASAHALDDYATFLGHGEGPHEPSAALSSDVSRCGGTSARA